MSLVCIHCEQQVYWSRLLDDWYCGDCRCSECEEVEEEEVL